MDANYHFSNIIGVSDAIKEVFALMEQAINSDSDVLITGETGTGKELVAREIHHNSFRKERPLLACNCGASPKELVASEIFGHRKGTFTEASQDKTGLFEAAWGGTVILDEIGDLPLDIQLNLLCVLQERKVQRIGEYISREVDVRVIAISNRDLSKEVEAGRFREDLYHQLNEFPIHLPPLRERLEDIPLLAEYFYQEVCRQMLKGLDGFDTPSVNQPKGFAPDVFDLLRRYHWPGNVRELRNEIRRACVLAEEDSRIQTHHFSSQITRRSR